MPVYMATEPGEPSEAAQPAFARLEAALPDLGGRRFYGYYQPEANRYVACVVARPDDDLELERAVVPGGAYARVRLHGEPDEVYGSIGPTFERIAAVVDVDPGRPWLEHYRRRDEVLLFVPLA